MRQAMRTSRQLTPKHIDPEQHDCTDRHRGNERAASLISEIAMLEGPYPLEKTLKLNCT